MISIKIPIPEKVSANAMYSGMHWSKRKALADLYHNYLLPYRIKTDVNDYPVDVSYAFSFKGKILDCSNVLLMTKLLEDGMVKQKILRGDAPDDVALITVSSKKGKLDEVEIIIS